MNFLLIARRLLSAWWLWLAVGSFAAGSFVTAKFYKAAEVDELRQQNKELKALADKGAKAEREKQKIEQKYRDLNTRLTKLRSSDADVDAYLSTPVPDSLRELHNAE